MSAGDRSILLGALTGFEEHDVSSNHSRVLVYGIVTSTPGVSTRKGKFG